MKSDHPDRALRLPIQLLVEYNMDGQSFDEFCTNLSSTGIFIETTTLYSKGSEIELAFTLPHSLEKVTTTGLVVWVREKDNEEGPAGMGIKFIVKEKSEFKELEQAIDHYHKIKQNRG